MESVGLIVVTTNVNVCIVLLRIASKACAHMCVCVCIGCVCVCIGCVSVLVGGDHFPKIAELK